MVKTTNIDRRGKTRKMKKLVYGPGNDCAFPFKFKGKLYDNECVKGETGDWCATSKTRNNYTDTWGYCEKQSPRKKSSKSSSISSSIRAPSPENEGWDYEKYLREKQDRELMDVIQKVRDEKKTPKKKKSSSSNMSPPPPSPSNSSNTSNKSPHGPDVLPLNIEDINSPDSENKKRKKSSSKEDSDGKMTQKHFDMILAKITYKFPGYQYKNEYKSLTFGKKKGKDIWIVMEPGGHITEKQNIDDALEAYMNNKDYFKYYEIINFEGFDDILLKKKVKELNFKDVDIKKCNNDKSGFGHGDDFKDIDKKKIIQVSNGNCYDIDELVGYLISQEGKNIDPIDSANGKTTPLWNNEDELFNIQNFPGIDPGQKKDFDKIMDKALIHLTRPPYINILNTKKGQEFMNKLIITGKICLEDYTEDGMYQNAATEISRTKEYLDENFSKDEKDKILDITTINGLTLRRWLYGQLGDERDNSQCVHGLGFKYSSFYFTAFTKIREDCDKLGNKMNLELFPGIVEIRKNVFIFCHGSQSSNFKNGAKYPLTGFIYDTQNSANTQGGTGRIFKIHYSGTILTGDLLDLNSNFAESQKGFFKTNLKKISGEDPKILLNQFADRPGANKPKSPAKVINCKKSKKKKSSSSSSKSSSKSSKSSKLSSKSSSQSRTKKIGETFFGLKEDGKIDKKNLNRNFILTQNTIRDKIELILNVTMIQNRYKITITKIKNNKTRNITNTISWWNPKKGNEGSPAKILQDKINMGFELS